MKQVLSQSRNSGFHFNPWLCWGTRVDGLRFKLCASSKAKIIRDCSCNTVTWMLVSFPEQWRRDKTITKPHMEEVWNTLFRNKKVIKNTRLFQKSLNIFLFCEEKTDAASYCKGLLLFYNLVLWKTDSNLK